MPLSAPSNNNLFNGNIAIEVKTPLNVSERNLVLENEASTSTDVCTPILLAVDPDINSVLYTLKQWMGSVAPLVEIKLYFYFYLLEIAKGNIACK